MSSDQTTAEAAPKTSVDYRKSTDFLARYANNVFLETSFWDLKMIFGQLDQQAGNNVIAQHSSITLPWPQVKVLLYFLSSNLLAHELQNGRVQIQSDIIMPVPEEAPPDVVKQFPKYAEIHEPLKALYREFISKNPEAAPSSLAKAPPKSKHGSKP